MLPDVKPRIALVPCRVPDLDYAYHRKLILRWRVKNWSVCDDHFIAAQEWCDCRNAAEGRPVC